MPGDVRLGAAESVPHSRSTRTRPATRFFINDVGQGAWEEVDLGAGRRRLRLERARGPLRQRLVDELRRAACRDDEPGLRLQPSRVRLRGDHRRRLRPNGIWPSAYDGTYLYGDYTCGKIFVLTPNGSGGYTRTEFADDVGAVVNMTFGPSPQGQGLYYTNYTNGGEVRRIESTASANRPPTARVTASPTFGARAARRQLRREREHRSGRG